MITVTVTDDGTPNLSATYSFIVVVKKANSAPVLTVPDTQTVDERRLWTCSYRQPTPKPHPANSPSHWCPGRMGRS